MRFIYHYCLEHGGFGGDITVEEFEAAIDRSHARNTGTIDRLQAEQQDMERLEEIACKSGFFVGDTTVDEALEKGYEVGAITDAELQEAREIDERVGYVEVPNR